MNYWVSVKAEAQKVHDTTLENSSDEVALLRRAISIYAEAFDIAEDPAEPKAAIVRKALISHNFNTLNVAIDAAIRGYYVQAIALLRNLYENWLAFWYVAKYQQEADKWLNPSWEQRPPKAEIMRNKIDHPSKESKSKLHGFYEELNRFDHTDPSAVLSIIEMDKENLIIRVGVQYNKKSFEACAYSLCLWSGNTLDTISSIVPSDNEWHDKYAKIQEELLSYIQKYNMNHKDQQKEAIPDQ
jgi:hypothetical protein